MSNMITDSLLVRKTLASLIASIAKIDIPRGEWCDLITNMCNNASNEEWQIRHTALITIGYICEELQPEDLTQQLRNTIMMALTNNISSDEANVEPCRLAVNALLNSVPFMAANF